MMPINICKEGESMKKLFFVLTVIMGIMLSTTCFAARQVGSFTNYYNACKVHVYAPQNEANYLPYYKGPRLTIYAKDQNNKPCEAILKVMDKKGVVIGSSKFYNYRELVFRYKDGYIAIFPVNANKPVYWIVGPNKMAEANFNSYNWDLTTTRIGQG